MNAVITQAWSVVLNIIVYIGAISFLCGEYLCKKAREKESFHHCIILYNTDYQFIVFRIHWSCPANMYCMVFLGENIDIKTE